ncbi:MAG TPA: peptide chain release factor N(5)-glutamine methyltransferase [Terriglobales bacterium]|nr:peptide chain release factor N(5)-glutamine methyltransferase [Terriglobales bacterium]
MTIRHALETAVAKLTAHDVGSPRMNAELLLMFVLGRERAFFYAYPERELTAEEELRYQEAIAERATGVPAQYITGHQEFWGLDFLVTPAVLIPRPETEHVVETALELARTIEHPRIIDVGTGTGCIALALAHELPQADITAVDISLEALEVAKVNSARLQLDRRVHFRRNDLLAGFAPEQFDLVVSNPPYVGEGESDKVQAEVRRFEPHVAVFAGAEGLDVLARLLPQAHDALKREGWVLVEIGFSQSERAERLAAGWSEVKFIPDLKGIPRVLAARK